jgi:hypothetical protein
MLVGLVDMRSNACALDSKSRYSFVMRKNMEKNSVKSRQIYW